MTGRELFELMLLLQVPILFLIVPIYLVLVWKTERRVEKIDPELWQEPGSPNLLWNNTIKNNLRFIRFLINREYTHTGDMRLACYARWSFRLLCVGIAVFVLVFPSMSLIGR